MMDIDPLEILWNSLLSRNAKRIRSVFAGLDKASQGEVLKHLKRMTTEEGWHPEQIKSAQSALDALSETHENEG